MSRRLGKNQRLCLRALHANGHYPGGGWVFGTNSETKKILASLAKHGLVDQRDIGLDTETGGRLYRYSINDAGREDLS